MHTSAIIEDELGRGEILTILGRGRVLTVLVRTDLSSLDPKRPCRKILTPDPLQKPSCGQRLEWRKVRQLPKNPPGRRVTHPDRKARAAERRPREFRRKAASRKLGQRCRSTSATRGHPSTDTAIKHGYRLRPCRIRRPANRRCRVLETGWYKSESHSDRVLGRTTALGLSRYVVDMQASPLRSVMLAWTALGWTGKETSTSPPYPS